MGPLDISDKHTAPLSAHSIGTLTAVQEAA